MKNSCIWVYLGLILCIISCTGEYKKNNTAYTRDSLFFTTNADSIEIYRRANIERAKYVIHNVEAYSDSLHVPIFIPKFYLHKAMVFHATGELDTALIYYEKAVVLAKKRHHQTMEALAYLNLGNLYYTKGNYVKSVEMNLQSLQMMEKINNQKGMSAIYGNLGLVYESMKDYPTALQYQEKSLALRKKIKDTLGIAQTFGNIGNIFYDKGDSKMCMEYQFKSLAIHRAIGNKMGIAITLSNIGQLYQEQNDLDSSLKYTNEGMKTREEIQDLAGLPFSYITLGLIYQKKGNTADAETLFLKAKEIVKKNSDFLTLKNVNYNLHELYAAQNKYKDALEAYKQFIVARDTVYNVQQIQEVNKRSLKYDYDKKEALAQIELEKQKLFRNGAIIGGGLLLGFLFIALRNFQNKKKANVLLQQQKHIIEEKQKEILDSILYAEQIQKTLIANHDLVNETIPDSFVFFKPKDIVSGDFYWAASVAPFDKLRGTNSEFGLKSNASSSSRSEPAEGAAGNNVSSSGVENNSELFYLAVCDSTGHGVPGAFMSLLNISFLNEAIKEKYIINPALVFEHVRKRLIETISQNGRKDGMDGILVCFNKQENTISYCAANNSPLLISDQKIIQLPGDKMPVGKGEKNQDFTLHTIPAKKGDMLYLFTDGYPDQFGGPKGKKFKYKQLEEFLLQIHALPVEKQQTELSKKFEEWKGPLEQIDDVCIIGIRI